MIQTRKPYLQYFSSGKPIIQMFHATEHNSHCLPKVPNWEKLAGKKEPIYVDTYFFCFEVPVCIEHPTGIYHEYNFRTAMSCLTAAQDAYLKFHQLPKKGGWR